MLFSRAKTDMVTSERAPAGRDGYAFT